MGQAMDVAELALEAEERQGSRVRTAIARAMDAQQGRGFLWWPVALVVGIAIYFNLPAEPSLVLTAAVAIAALVLIWFGRAAPVILLVGLVALGFALAKLRTESVATPLLRATTAEVAISGQVIKVERTSRGRLAILLSPAMIEGFTADRVPLRLRLSAPIKAGLPMIGSRIAVKARLSPVPTPVEPGGFDYGRQLWFEQVGGTGRVTSPITLVDAEVPLRARLDAVLSDVRSAMGARIHAALDEPYASFAEALITGERSTIPKEINQSLLVSGLFHILSISGLHMWLVAGGVFWTVRAGFALIPVLALRYPIKKWAAAAALLMGLFYMLLADGGVATQRSFIMIAVVFFAVMVDRPALSARNLALAALVVLVFEPEAAIEASFQMSFLAVLGLVAFYEVWGRFKAARDGEKPERHWAMRILLWLAAATAASLLTSLVAAFASSIPAAYHFGRISPYGLLANGLAIPVVGLIVMPAALLAAVLMPLGLETLPLIVMAKGLELVIIISDGVAALPGANMVAARPPELAMVLMASGTVILCLLAGWVRLIGGVIVVTGLIVSLVAVEGPDILIERTAQNVAIRDAGGHLVTAWPKRARFTVEKWLQADGDEAKPAEAAARPGWSCAETRCIATVKGKKLVYMSRAEGKPVDCSGADIVIADFPLRSDCKAVTLRIDRFDLWRWGAHALRIGSAGITVETARSAQGARPWVVVPERRATPYVPRVPQAAISPD